MGLPKEYRWISLIDLPFIPAILTEKPNIMIKKVIKTIPHVRHTDYFVTANRKNLKRIKFNDYEEYYVTVCSDFCNGNFLKKSLSDLEKKGMKIVRVVLFGEISRLKKIIKVVSAYPAIFLGHSNNSKKCAEFCGAEIVAIKGKFSDFEYIEFNKKIVGVLFKVPGREHLYISGLEFKKTNIRIGFRVETKRIYECIDDILTRYKFSPQNVYRFWNCMENILGNNITNYALFNEVRDEYFEKHGIADYPAATGIEAALPKEQNINLSLESVKAKKNKDVYSKTLHSDFQCEAWEYKKYKAWKYGPKFSRAKLLVFKKDKIKKVYVSGTSNVDWKGCSILLEDNEKNINYVVSCVEHLLKKSGVSLDNVVSSRLYFKNYGLYKTFLKIYRKKKWKFPYNSLFANICRENFFFEMECVAAGKMQKDAYG
jgi:enamine deaminase RidA (YjgF/YER057c/UK114 family)